MSISDQQLLQLIETICCHTDVLGWERRVVFTRLLPHLQALPIRFKRPGRKYLQALDKTWKWVAINLCSFQVSPHEPIHMSLERWISEHLRQELAELEHQPEPDLDIPLLSDLDNFETFWNP